MKKKLVPEVRIVIRVLLILTIVYVLSTVIPELLSSKEDLEVLFGFAIIIVVGVTLYIRKNAILDWFANVKD